MWTTDRKRRGLLYKRCVCVRSETGRMDVELVYFPSPVFHKLCNLSCKHRNELYEKQKKSVVSAFDEGVTDEVMETATPPFTVSFTQPPRSKVFSVRVLPVSAGGGDAIRKTYEDAYETKVVSAMERVKRGKALAKTRHVDPTADVLEDLFTRLGIVAKQVNRHRFAHKSTVAEMCSMPAAYYDPEIKDWVGSLCMQLYSIDATTDHYSRPTELEGLLRKCYETCVKLLSTKYDMIPIDTLDVSVAVNASEEDADDAFGAGKPTAVLKSSYKQGITEEAALKRLFALAAATNGGIYTNGKLVVWFGAAFPLPSEYVYRNMVSWMRTACPFFVEHFTLCNGIVQDILLQPETVDSVIWDLVSSLRYADADRPDISLPHFHQTIAPYALRPAPSVFVSDKEVPLCIKRESVDWNVPHWAKQAEVVDETCLCKYCFDPDDYSEDDETTCENEVCTNERKKRRMQKTHALWSFANRAPLECVKNEMLVNAYGTDYEEYYVSQYNFLTASHVRIQRN